MTSRNEDVRKVGWEEGTAWTKGPRWVIRDAYREYEGLHWAWSEGHLEGQSGVEKLAKRLASIVGIWGRGMMGDPCGWCVVGGGQTGGQGPVRRLLQ